MHCITMKKFYFFGQKDGENRIQSHSDQNKSTDVIFDRFLKS